MDGEEIDTLYDDVDIGGIGMMMISVTEPDCKHSWHIDNPTAVLKTVLVGQGCVTVEFMDSKAY